VTNRHNSKGAGECIESEKRRLKAFGNGTATYRVAPRKRAFALLGVLLLLAGTITPVAAIAAVSTFNNAGFVQIEDEVFARNFTLENLENQPVALSDFREKVVLLFFWTSW
jgi:cytochrome oxidase Cu insertion factor (SCO1/SenC/PrrC family)